MFDRDLRCAPCPCMGMRRWRSSARSSRRSIRSSCKRHLQKACARHGPSSSRCSRWSQHRKLVSAPLAMASECAPPVAAVIAGQRSHRFREPARRARSTIHALGHAHRGRLANIGLGGMYVATEVTFPDHLLGRIVDLELRFDGALAAWQRTTGRVKRISGTGVAIVFDAPTTPALLRMIDGLTTASHASARVVSVVLIDGDAARRALIAAGFRATGCEVMAVGTRSPTRSPPPQQTRCVRSSSTITRARCWSRSAPSSSIPRASRTGCRKPPRRRICRPAFASSDSLRAVAKVAPKRSQGQSDARRS
jgi:hypothetical protein